MLFTYVCLWFLYSSTPVWKAFHGTGGHWGTIQCGFREPLEGEEYAAWLRYFRGPPVNRKRGWASSQLGNTQFYDRSRCQRSASSTALRHHHRFSLYIFENEKAHNADFQLRVS